MAIFTGCGKKAAPDPPLTETKLVLRIFKDLQLKQHQRAADQITRLIAMKPDDEFLYQLKTSELDNIYLDHIQVMVAENKLDEAIDLLRKAEVAQGRNKRFVEIQKDLQTLVEIRNLVQAIEYPVSGEKLEADAVKLKAILRDYKPGLAYLPVVEEKIAISRLMRRTEQHRALFSIYSDIAVARKNGDKDMASLLTAVLICAEPDRKTRDLADYVIQNCTRQEQE